MHIVAIHGWEDATDALTGSLAQVLGLVPFEARQRLLSRGPAVVANLAEAQAARNLAAKLDRIGLRTLVIDAPQANRPGSRFAVRRFRFEQQILRIETCEGPTADIPYGKIHLLIAATHIVPALTETSTERKISLKKTALAGGIPLHKEVKRQEIVREEQRQEMLYLRAGQRSVFIFRPDQTKFDGLGTAMQLTRERNLALLKQQIRQSCPELTYDDRLLTRSGQARLLGPTLSPEQHFDLALDILCWALSSTPPKAEVSARFDDLAP
jgi:hypothetical protein